MKLEKLIRRHVTGEPVTVDLGDGDSITLHLTQAQGAYFARAVELEFEARKVLGMTLKVTDLADGDEPPAELKLPAAHQQRILTEALIGTVLVGWESDGLEVNGQPFRSTGEKGELHKDNARTLLAVPEIAIAVMKHLHEGVEAERAEVARGKGRRSKRSSGA